MADRRVNARERARLTLARQDDIKSVLEPVIQEGPLQVSRIVDAHEIQNKERFLDAMEEILDPEGQGLLPDDWRGSWRWLRNELNVRQPAIKEEIARRRGGAAPAAHAVPPAPPAAQRGGAAPPVPPVPAAGRAVAPADQAANSVPPQSTFQAPGTVASFNAPSHAHNQFAQSSATASAHPNAIAAHGGTPGYAPYPVAGAPASQINHQYSLSLQILMRQNEQYELREQRQFEEKKRQHDLEMKRLDVEMQKAKAKACFYQ